MPVSVAVEIAEADDEAVQQVLQLAYERSLLRRRKLIAAKRLVECRRRRGKGLATVEPKRDRWLSVHGLLRTYRESADKKRLLVRKADATRGRLVFVTEALRKLVADEKFIALLRSEKLDTLPQPLADRLQGELVG